MISKVNQKKRFLYAKEYRNHPDSYWNNVMYVDEKKFVLICNPRKQYIWRRKNTAYDDGNTQAYTRSESVMAWGAFGANGVGDIVIIPSTMNSAMYRDILKKYLRSSAKKIGLKRGWKLLQDNDPKHTSKIVKSELSKMKIKCINHPAQSPDMNPIANLWDHVDRKICATDRYSKKSMSNTIISEWNNIPKISVIPQSNFSGTVLNCKNLLDESADPKTISFVSLVV